MTMWEDMGSKSVFALTNTTGSINSTVDALGKINNIKYNTFGEAVEGIKRQLSTGILLPLGQEVLPILNEFGNYLQQNMPQIIGTAKSALNELQFGFKVAKESVGFLIDNFNIIAPVITGVVAGFTAFKVIGVVTALMDAWKASTIIATIAQSGLNVAMAANPIGLTVLAIAGLVAGVTLVYKNFDMLKAKFLELDAPIKAVVATFLLFNPITAPILAIVGAIKSVQYAMSDSIPKADLFGKGISEGTKKAVQGYLDLDNNATKSLMNLKFSGTTITKETADNLSKTFNDMGTQIKAGIDKHYGDSYKTMKDFFSNSSALSVTEEQKILANMTKDNENKKKLIDDGEKQIKDILTTASNNKRALTLDEQAKINAIQNTMKTNAVKSLSDTEVESKSILERMKQQAGDVTAKQAAEVVKNSVEQKDKAIKNANEQYDKTVQSIIKQRDETGTISADQAQKLIADAKKTRDDSVKSAEDMNNKVVEQAKKQSKDHVNEVDWTTGEVKSKWQAMVDDVSQKMSDIGKDTKQKWEDVKKDTSEKFNDIKEKASQKWEDIKTAIEKPINKAKDTVKKAVDDIYGFFANLHLPEIKIPEIKLPHFSFSGNFSLNPPSVPTFNPVKWYDKGGIFSSPSIIGVGEKRPEFVGALDDLRTLIGSELDKRLVNNGSSNNEPIYITVISELDGEKVAKGIAQYSDKIQGKNLKLSARGVGGV